MTNRSEHFELHPDYNRNSRDLRLFLTIASMLLAATVLLTFTQVVLRFGFSRPQAWAEEVARYLLVWITFLGAAIAFSRDTHIRLDAIVKLAGPTVEHWLDLARRVIEALAAVILVYAGTLVAWQNRNSVFYTVPDAPQVIFYLAVPVGGVLMLFYILRNIWRVRHARKVDHPPPYTLT